VHPEFSFLYHPLNALLVALFGPPSAGWKQAMGMAADEVAWLPDHVVMAIFVVAVVAVMLITARRRYSLGEPSLLQQILELLLSGIRNMCDDVIGHGLGGDFVPFISALAFFIFLANISELLFFLQPATANTSTTFALSITAFIFYNIVGIRRKGPIAYAKSFAGPVWWLFPLMVPLEIISHLARVLSLALRLFGNILAEHTATGIFMTMVPFVIPWGMMGLGIIGCTIQAFIFMILTAVYISGAVAEEH
jgi:F-type H+-transporting ATPase subunit a